LPIELATFAIEPFLLVAASTFSTIAFIVALSPFVSTSYQPME
jgi:hypothetical protein